MNGNIFIGWSKDPSLAESVRQQLQKHGYGARVGGKNNERIGHGVSATIIEQMNECCGAIMLFSKRNIEAKIVGTDEDGIMESLSLNMLFEFGYMTGTKQIDRVYLVYLDCAKKLAPSDMEGMWSVEISTEGREFEDIASEIVEGYLKNQKDSVVENKMRLICSISHLKWFIRQHIKKPTFFDSEMAKIVVILCQASYLFGDMTTCEQLVKDLQKDCNDEDHLRLAIISSIIYYDICNNLVEEDGVMHLPDRYYKKVVYRLQQAIDEASDLEGDEEFKYMFLMICYDYLSFANLMYFKGDNICEWDEDKIFVEDCCKKSIENAIKFQELNMEKNKELSELYLGYMHRNLALFYKDQGRLDEADYEFEESIRVRYNLFIYCDTRDLNKIVKDQMKMEYNLALSDNILDVDPDKRRRRIRELDNYIIEAKEQSYDRMFQNKTIEDKLNLAKQL